MMEFQKRLRKNISHRYRCVDQQIFNVIFKKTLLKKNLKKMNFSQVETRSKF